MSVPDPRTAVAEMLGLDPAAGYPTGDSLQADQFRAMAQLMGVNLPADPTQSGADVGVELPHEPIRPGPEPGVDEAPVVREVGAATLSLVQAGSSVAATDQKRAEALPSPTTPSLRVVNPDVEADGLLGAQTQEPPEDELVGQEPPDLGPAALLNEGEPEGDDPHYRTERLPQARPQATPRDPQWGEAAMLLQRHGALATLPRELRLMVGSLAYGKVVPKGWAERKYFEPLIEMLAAVARGETPQPYVDSTKPAARQAAHASPPRNSDVPAVLEGLDVRHSMRTVHLPQTDQPVPADPE